LDDNMKTLLILLATSVICVASTITFTGTITSVGPNSPFRVGDVFIARFQFDAVTRVVNRSTITVEIQQFRHFADGTRIAYDNDPCSPSVYFQAIESPYVDITMQAITQDCNIPAIDQFNLNDFIFMDSFGHMTGIPRIRP
jgi:hypothetical protein